MFKAFQSFLFLYIYIFLDNYSIYQTLYHFLKLLLTYKIKYNYKDREQFDNRVKVLDNIIEKRGRTDYGDYYYRGRSTIEVKGIKVGDVYNPKQYISTILLQSVSNSFMGNDGEDVVIKFNNKNKKIKGFYMDTKDNMPEFEVLIERNNKFVCTKITKESNIFVYEMEVKDV